MNVRQNTRGTAAIPASTIDECTISKGECTKTVVIAIHGTASLQSYQLAKHRKRGVLPSSGSLFETVPSLVFHTNCMQHSQGCFCILYLGFCQKRLEFSLSLSFSLWHLPCLSIHVLETGKFPRQIINPHYRSCRIQH